MSFLYLLLALTSVLFVWVHWVEPNWFHLKRKTIRIKKPLSRPLTILHLSDLHFTGPRRFLEGFFDQLAELEADFVFVTGDLIDSAGGIPACVNNLKKLKPKQGTYVVLGNHDYEIYPLPGQIKRIINKKKYGIVRPEAEALKRALEDAGLQLLINENVSLPLAEGEKAVVIGIDDPYTGHADLKKAFHGIENGRLHLALVHSPVIYPSLTKMGIDIAFSGHTHGGQIRLPGMGPLGWVKRIEPIIDSTDEFGFIGLVSRGMGAGPMLRLRFFCRPEAVLVKIIGTGSARTGTA